MNALAASTAQGGCRCGQVRLRVSGAPLFTAACHCRGCQRMSASAFSLSSCYMSDQVEILSGEPAIGGLHGPTRHYFCPHCFSWMFTRPEGMDEIVNLRTTMLDEPPQDKPFLETYTSTALSWVKTGATHSFETFPPVEHYRQLIVEFARTWPTN
ncbi:GFA family protein [Sphingobium nicotianae]|uniref:GFA family protein n=1 Tax=Sphingobium nicotianae TaxID=2782607 RepID=A0A9X1D9P2_9SPHN|nr:GFA family protein [Sphingobium nicotianae]MBT2185942.1 GFA family protein [Sphingobium nicotianae]